ncbi:MAG: DnaJ domain-containing protein [Chloroflexi bacterium]|nr:DnaJ domain-containing protein [Chloroflexota bacterium]
MSPSPDYYRILQVHPSAEKGVIDAAYRKLAAQYHPDVSYASDASERMKQLNLAYEVLSDPVRRAAYDASRSYAPRNSPPSHAARSRPSSPWRPLLVAAALIFLGLLVVRTGPAFLVVAPRLLLPLLVISLVLWLLISLSKRGR